MLYHRRVGSCQNFILKANLRYSGFLRYAGDLVDNLMEQIKQFEPGFTLGERAETIENKKTAVLTSNEGTQFHSKWLQSQVV
jgi:hypothetical protein